MSDLSNKDFVSDQDVRWCPDAEIMQYLRSMQKALPLLNKNKEDFVFISGIDVLLDFHII